MGKQPLQRGKRTRGEDDSAFEGLVPQSDGLPRNTGAAQHCHAQPAAQDNHDQSGGRAEEALRDAVPVDMAVLLADIRDGKFSTEELMRIGNALLQSEARLQDAL